MAIRTAIALWIPSRRISPGQLAPTVAAELPALVQQRVPVVVHRLVKPEVTFVRADLDLLSGFHPYATRPNLLDPVAAKLARLLRVPIFNLFAMAGSAELLRVAAFSDTGAPLWVETQESAEPFERLVGALTLPKRKYFSLVAKDLLEPRGRGWKRVGEVRSFHPDPGDLPPELLQTGDYELFDPLPAAPAPAKAKAKRKKAAARKLKRR
jgi:hypothetical protein